MYDAEHAKTAEAECDTVSEAGCASGLQEDASQLVLLARLEDREDLVSRLQLRLPVRDSLTLIDPQHRREERT